MNRMSRKGFTLIELLVVIAIIGVLIGMLFPAVKGAISSAQRQQALSSVKAIESAFLNYRAEYGRFPLQTSSSVDIIEQWTSGPLMNILRGLDVTENPRKIPFIDVPKKYLGSSNEYLDPWGRMYKYAIDYDGNNIVKTWSDVTGHTVCVWSKGPDEVNDFTDNIPSW